MTILLIEDEPLIGKQLSKMVHKLEPEAIIDGPLTNLQQVTDYLNRQHPDLIITDIQLEDGVSFDAFQHANTNIPVIFTTAYDEYAIRAFKLNSLDYLLKPIDPDELRAALTKFHQWRTANVSFTDQFQTFLAQFSGKATTPAYKRRFTAHYGRQIMLVQEDQIACFNRHELIYLLTTDGRRLVTDYRTLEEVDELIDPVRFFRANRQFVVHIDAVSGYSTHHTGRLTVHLKAPHETLDVVVSKEKAPSFRQWIEA